MQAAYDGAVSYLTGRMPGAPIPHAEIAAKGHKAPNAGGRRWGVPGLDAPRFPTDGRRT
jgi:hypothetical protein